jgi:hypothetical protein
MRVPAKKGGQVTDFKGEDASPSAFPKYKSGQHRTRQDGARHSPTSAEIIEPVNGAQMSLSLDQKGPLSGVAGDGKQKFAQPVSPAVSLLCEQNFSGRIRIVAAQRGDRVFE